MTFVIVILMSLCGSRFVFQKTCAKDTLENTCKYKGFRGFYISGSRRNFMKKFLSLENSGKTSENTLREFPLVIATVAKVSRMRGLWLVVRVNKMEESR